jgi:hypothetical protein
MASKHSYTYWVVDDQGQECVRWTGVVSKPTEVTAIPDYGPRVRLVRDGELVSVARGHRTPGRPLYLHRQRTSGGHVVVREIPPAWKGLYEWSPLYSSSSD